MSITIEMLNVSIAEYSLEALSMSKIMTMYKGYKTGNQAIYSIYNVVWLYFIYAKDPILNICGYFTCIQLSV